MTTIIRNNWYVAGIVLAIGIVLIGAYAMLLWYVLGR